MPLIQIQEGLRESDNFYMSSNFGEFLGNGVCSRGINYFELKVGEIKRNLSYPDFCIVVHKNGELTDHNSIHKFFVELEHVNSKERIKCGINEIGSDSEGDSYWKLLTHGGFIQTYSSTDGVNWVNKGGHELKDYAVIYQGFEVVGDTPLKILDYQVFYSPLITVQNIAPKSIIRLYDSEGKLQNERECGNDMQASMFITHEYKGYLKVLTPQGAVLASTETINLIPGSIFSYTPYYIDVEYQGSIINHGPTYLNRDLQLLRLYNRSDETYHNLKVSVSHITSSSDTVEVSLDGTNFSGMVTIFFMEQNKAQELYLRITRSNPNTYRVEEFELQIY